ncbi:lysylphosphatidylglycerol synthase domain-containing protein [Rhizohabitans arisaemae]|uniref:lysylphosphatidylglycerol synthase domain-containing protein n=1 Tax=Rhizohabitans arisaemae TaxID=2720610 RepID=UPI0024B1366D|nr:lysylphosphatidylglycerol synthase domain-containing protein [Rhizohabitans arisaemae]
MTKPTRRTALRAAFVVVALGLGGYAVADQWPQVREGLARLSVPLLVGSLAAVLVALAASMLVWRALLADLGSPLPVRPAARVFFLGQLGKYLPGSLWPLLAQMELGRDLGVPRPRSAAAFVLGMLVFLGSGIAVGVIAAGTALTHHPWLLALLPPLLLALHPRVVDAVVGAALRRLGKAPLERPLTWGGVLRAAGWAGVAWLAYGTHLALLAWGLGARGPGVLVLATGAFALAWAAGLIVVVAPAGLGVREVVLVAALAPVLEEGSTLIAALCSRLIVTVGDLLCALLAVTASKRRRDFGHFSGGSGNRVDGEGEGGHASPKA